MLAVTFLGAAPPQNDQFVLPSSARLTAQDFTLLGKVKVLLKDGVPAFVEEEAMAGV